MKKFLMFAALSAVLCVATTSCDEEDDDKGGDNYVVPTEESDFDGERLISVGSDGDYTNFSYNDDGSLRQITYNNDKLTFDYTNGTITFSDNISAQKASFTTNKKGYITELSQSGTEEDSKWTVSYRFQYNGSDHLTNVAVNDVYTDLSTKEKETTDITWKLTWNGDLLSSVKINGSDNEGKWGENITFTYTDAAENRYMQYTNNVITAIDLDGNIEDPMYVGLFGKGPSKYPSEIKTEDTYEQEYYTDFITYDLNSKGLVERETSDSGDGYSWAVDYTYDSLSQSYAPAADNKAGVGRKHHRDSRNHTSLFGRKK